MTGKYGGYTAFKNIIDIIKKDKKVDFKLLVTDQHMNSQFGETANIIKNEIKKENLIFLKTLKQKDTTISKLKPGVGGEIHITDAIRKMIYKNEKFVAHRFLGKYLDCGSMEGYINSSKEISNL